MGEETSDRSCFGLREEEVQVMSDCTFVCGNGVGGNQVLFRGFCMGPVIWYKFSFSFVYAGL
jgi:hypothetical protein